MGSGITVILFIYILKTNTIYFLSAQREGFLSEAHSEEVDQADPFYAHCKLHSDKTLVRRRKRNYMALELRTHYRRLQFEQAGHTDTPEQQRIQRKLEKQRQHYYSHKILKSPPWGKKLLDLSVFIYYYE